jgi:hypothetical protein
MVAVQKIRTPCAMWREVETRSAEQWPQSPTLPGRLSYCKTASLVTLDVTSS